MSMTTPKLIGIIALGGSLLASAACGPLDSVTGGGKSAACDNIKTELKNLSTNTAPSNAADPTASAAANAAKYSTTASNIRSEGQKAGGDVARAADDFAGDLDNAAAILRNLSNGNTSAASGTGSLTQMSQHGQALGKACGFTSTFRFGG
ncbi:hypothetical protein [Actinomadura parmotrematis]|uniref:Lipoprotein n=1 Tax=Actinomadura parmotrematis TaxID=2864039 RepID=A0ABS7FNE6_9ACTN|nr:hypothetical protein [Actinomadura parmotrematis]MBW8481912.1 hypothetical protein [Actinomadura parmotrematis]